MKINGIHLESITSYDEATLRFPKQISVILGANAAGKTTILDAINYALTKACQRTDKAGKGAENMVRTGSKQGEIALSVSANGAEPMTVGRKIPGEMWIEGRTGNATILQEALCDELGVDVGVLSAALSTTAFIDAKPGDQKSLLFGLLGLTAERSKITTMIAEAAGDEAAEMVSKALGSFTGNYSQDLGATFENLHKVFYDRRRDVNRDIKNLGEPPAPLKLDEEDPPALEEVVGQIEDLRGQKAGLSKQLTEITVSARERTRLNEQIEMFNGLLEDAGDPEEAQAEHKKVQEKIASLVADQHVALARAESHQTAADKLAGASKACPLAPKLVDCSMTKPKREKMVAEMRAIAEAALVEAGKLGTKIAPLQKRESELAVDAKKPSKEGLEFQISVAEKALADLPTGDPGGLEEKLAALTARIKNGEEVLADLNRLEGQREAHAQQVTSRAKLEQEAEVLDALVKVLSPAGLLGKILSETIGPIEEHANQRLSELTGGRYSLHLVLDPDFLILVDHDGVTTDLKRLSSSERFRIGLILQEAIVHLSGLKFLIIDNADVLDSDNRAFMMDALLAMAPEMDQIIVLSTIGPAGAHKPDPPIEELGLYLLKDGQLEEVE